MIKLFMLAICLVWPVGARAMADSVPPVYGRPTLYGEYEITGIDVARAGDMYGATPRAIQAGAAAKHPVAKHPVKPKRAKPKARKSSVRAGRKVPIPPKPKPAVLVKEESKPVEIVAEPVSEKEIQTPEPVIETNIPGEYASEIKGALANKYDVSSYCVQVQSGDGVMPDGFILMPGRPDLMSCTGR